MHAPMVAHMYTYMYTYIRSKKTLSSDDDGSDDDVLDTFHLDGCTHLFAGPDELESIGETSRGVSESRGMVAVQPYNITCLYRMFHLSRSHLKLSVFFIVSGKRKREKFIL